MQQKFTGALNDSTILSISITPSTTKTFMLTQEVAQRCMSLPYGQAAPLAAQTIKFFLSGLITTPATGTLIIDPTHGAGTSATAGGTSLGASPAQTVTASLATKPYRITGEITYRIPSTTATSATAYLTGIFMSQGTLATAGGGWVIPFGGVATSVDTTGVAGTFGALNFYVTFSVTGATITVEHCGTRSLT